MTSLGARCVQELPPGGDIVKEILHDQFGTWRTTDGGSRDKCAPFDAQTDPDFLSDMAGCACDTAYCCNAGQGLPSKAQGTDMFQIGGCGEFAGRMAPERQGGLSAGDAFAVVTHPDQCYATLACLDLNTACACVKAVLYQFLDDRSWTLHDLASSNAGGDILR